LAQEVPMNQQKEGISMQIQGSVVQATEGFELVIFPHFDARIVVGPGEDHVQWTVDWFSAAVFGQTGTKIIISGRRQANSIVVSCMNTKELIATMIFRLRQAQDLSLQDLAAELGLKSHTMLSRYETGKHEPSLSQLQRILHVFHQDLALAPSTTAFLAMENPKRVA